MMAARQSSLELLARLPEVRGRYQADAPLHKFTWFRVGGPAQVVFRPVDADDLARFLAAKPADVPVTVIGVGSNLLIRDGGVDGVVVRLMGAFSKIRIDGRHVIAGAGAADMAVATACQTNGVGGLEFLNGIPGSIGGAVRMNAGAYESEVADVLTGASAIDPSGVRHDLDRTALGFSYRRCATPQDWIFIEATFEGRAEHPSAIAARMAAIASARETSQPTRARTGGSTFKNPGRIPGLERADHTPVKAWELIDQAGCRGLKVGNAMVSEKHCNFLVNTGGATAAELEELGETVRQRVHAQCGVMLEWEIDRIGVAEAAP